MVYRLYICCRIQKSHLDLFESIDSKTNVIEVTDSVLEASLSTKSPDGVASICSISCLPNPIKDDEADFVLALDRVQDPGNLGTLFRTALASEVQSIWLALGADPLNQKTVRSSAGAVEKCIGGDDSPSEEITKR